MVQANEHAWVCKNTAFIEKKAFCFYGGKNCFYRKKKVTPLATMVYKKP
jgi:hypothetical protein